MTIAKFLKKIHGRLGAATGQGCGWGGGQQAEGCGQEEAGRGVWLGGSRQRDVARRQKGVVRRQLAEGCGFRQS